MLVSHRKKFIFTKTIKTAGTSVESYYEPFCMPEGTWKHTHMRDEYISEAGIIGRRGRRENIPEDCQFTNHMPAAQIKELVGDEIWNDYFKFTVIRNPFSKLVSAWYHFHKPATTYLQTFAAALKTPKSSPLLLTDRRDIVDFRSWLQQGGTVIDRNKYLIKDKICVDFFIRQEFLEEDILKVNTRLGIDPGDRTIPRLKTNIRDKKFKTREFYNSKVEAIARKQFAIEFKLFNYDMPQ